MTDGPPRHFTEPTTAYWQRIVAPHEAGVPLEPPWRYGYAAPLPDGQRLVLPIRALASEPRHAVASLILNQASLEVVDTLGAMLAERLRPLAPELLLGLPTLGLALVPVVARHLGHARYVPLGYSRKFWYREELSAPVQSITSPVPGKRIYLDPNQLPLVEGRRCVLIDDAVSTGTTLAATWDLLSGLGVDLVGCGVAMVQGQRWREKLGEARAQEVVGVFDSPLLEAVEGGWGLRR